MTDNELIVLFKSVIETGLTDRGYTGVTVIAAAQPTQQGIPTGPTVYFTKLYDKVYGSIARSTQNDIDPSYLIRIESQQYETAFQINTLVIQNPASLSYTASDLANEIALILMSEDAINTFIENGVGILRVTDVRAPVFRDDRDRYEYSPSFDFTLTHKRTRTSRIQVIKSTEIGIYPI